jgi:hypothetical protein
VGRRKASAPVADCLANGGRVLEHAGEQLGDQATSNKTAKQGAVIRAELDRSLAYHADAIKAAGTRVMSDVVEIGRHLTEAKKLCGHGNWLPWLEREFGWTDQTARNFMRVFDLSNSKRVLDLDLPRN